MAAGASWWPRRRSKAAEKAPYRVLYSNDTTHLEYCISPYRKAGERFRPEFLEKSVDETAGIGVDVHLLQPGTGWVPWWKSDTYPADDHYRWWADRYGLPLSGFAQYMLDGGDMVEVFARRCRERNLAPFVSLRLNDSHGLEFAGASQARMRDFYAKTPELGWIPQLWSRVYADHPEYRIDASSHDSVDQLWDWRHDEVRAHKLGLLRELCANYDLDGLELDLNRDPFFFNTQRTTPAERRKIMTGFIRDVREMLDASGSEKRLCLRVPNALDTYDRTGLDLGAISEAGVDMLNVSSSYYTYQVFDLETMRRRVGRDVALYVEMTHCTSLGRVVSDKGYDSATFRRTTPAQFRTTADLAYARGADGVSLFNFVYYRDHEGSQPELRGPFHEPPFEVIPAIRDRLPAGDEPRDYFLGNLLTWNRFFKGTGPPWRQLPQTVRAGGAARFTMDMELPDIAGSTATLIVQTQEPAPGLAWSATLNGAYIGSGFAAAPVEEPFRTRANGRREVLRAWRFPADLLASGKNEILVSASGAGQATVVFVRIRQGGIHAGAPSG